MKLLFIHEAEKIKHDIDGNKYTDGSYDENAWQRYLSICDSLTVVMRRDRKEYGVDYAMSHFNKIPNSINIIEIPDILSSKTNFLNLYLRKKRREIIRKAVEDNDSVINRVPGNSFAINYAKRMGKTSLAEVVGCPFDALWNHSFEGKIRAIPSMLTMKHAVKNAPYVIYVTKEYLQKKYPTNGISTNCSNVVLKQQDEHVLIERIEKISKKTVSDPLIIGTAAAIDVPYKGQRYVIETIGDIKKRKGATNIVYQLVGGGSKERLLEYAKANDVVDQVQFIGALPHEKVYEWLKQIDVYIQPSLTEGLPRALIEAMSCGVPSIGADSGGIPELLDKRFVYKKGKNTVKNIERVFNLLTKDENMVEQAKRNFAESLKYDKETIEQRRKEMLNKLK